MSLVTGYVRVAEELSALGRRRRLGAKVLLMLTCALMIVVASARDADAAEGAPKLTLTGPADATIYYTLDGSDPRLTQGAISSSAVIYSGPITLERDARVTTRGRNPEKRQIGGPPASTPWSSPVSADFTITPR